MVITVLTYHMDHKRVPPLYICLYNNIKSDILCGKLKPNERLPSKRNLAEHLKISTVTVENAYAQLLLEGYIFSIERKGYFVSKLQEPLPGQSVQNIRENRSDQGEDAKKYIYDFKTNNILKEKFPFSIWARLMRETLSEQDDRLLEAMPYNGIQPLRAAIADYLYHFRGMTVSADQIVIGAGTEYLYGLIIQLLGRENVFALEDPGYKKIAKVYQSNGANCEFIGMDGSGLSVTELKSSNANIVHISPSHHFPTGIVMPIKRRHELLMWANEHAGRYIIEDEYDSEFRFSGRPVQTLQSIDHNQKVIYVNTFSKSIAPSIRISYMILPRHLTEKFEKNLTFYSCTVPSFEQFTLAKFIAGGYFERHINRMRNYYKKQRDLLISLLKSSRLGNRITIFEEHSGLHFLMKIDTGRSDVDIINSAGCNGIKLSCLSEYYYEAKRQKSGTVIINYSGIDSNKIQKAVGQLLKVFG